MTRLEKKVMTAEITVVILIVAILLGAAGQRRIVAKTLAREATEQIGNFTQSSDRIFVNYGAKISIPKSWPLAEKDIIVTSDDYDEQIIQLLVRGTRVMSDICERDGIAYKEVSSYAPVENTGLFSRRRSFGRGCQVLRHCLH